ncbi:MAG: hypothetical protein FD145_1504 [Candidatus Saganbacteria bacterium]|uniref:Superinfection immunity protein n=1 Tax=Candidatus Saganbacteria bacterium TaxID=2575572 RepID=A0A833KZT8_UNCSA|nr:MAG: hypothetical protein FD145_1504 [Candidatus Saganbacteria bacterium]
MTSGAWLVLIMLLVGYFLPSIVAAIFNSHNFWKIYLLNLFVGWSGIGWVACFILVFTLPGKSAPQVKA